MLKDCSAVFLVNVSTILIVLGEGSYEAFYESTFSTGVRPHQSLEKNSPVLREIEASESQDLSVPQIGGLHHRYLIAA
jgi:hypothetical protein